MSETNNISQVYDHHTDIHNDELRLKNELAETVFHNPKSQFINNPILRMELSGRMKPIDNFAISSVDTSNFRYFEALFTKMGNEATVSSHKIIFSGLDDILEHTVIYINAQREILDLMYQIQKSTAAAIHLKKITLTI